MTQKVDYKDRRGRWYKVLLPDGVSIDQAEQGILIGPPDVVDYLKWPKSLATVLHNKLFERGLFTRKDVEHRPQELRGAILSAISGDVAKLHAAYVSLEKDGENEDN